jgi:hypothetical protein
VNRYNGYSETPKPPPHIWKQMEYAGKTGDRTALGIARQAYTAWLAEQGIPYRAGTTRPDEAIR